MDRDEPSLVVVGEGSLDEMCLGAFGVVYWSALEALTESQFLAAVRSADGHRCRVPVYRSLPADLLTPLSSYLRLRGSHSHSFLFESVEGGDHLARYSFVGMRPRAVLRSWGAAVELEEFEGEGAGETQRVDRDPRSVLRTWLEEAVLVRPEGLPRFTGGAVGFFAFDAVRLEEDIPRTNPDPLQTPDIDLAFHEEILAFDHMRGALHLIRTVDLPAGVEDDEARDRFWNAQAQLDELEGLLARPVPPLPTPTDGSAPEFVASMDGPAYEAAVEQAQEYIRAGDIFQVVLSRRLSAPLRVDPLGVYRALRVLNPSPYLFFLEMGEHTLVGASPELLVRVEDCRVQTLPIAGTRPRGASAAEDRALEELLADPKELAEHEMLVDLGRNDLGRVSRFGSVQVKEHREVHRFSHVMHLVSRVTGELREECDALDALFACLPAGTVSGAPKVRALEIIEELEPMARGVYAGAVGYLDAGGDLDTCIAIRTVVCAAGQAHVQAGAGIVYDSVPRSEFEETHHKASALLEALKWAEEGRFAGVGGGRL